MIVVSTKQFCRSFEFALVLELLVVRQGKCVAAGTRVNFELDLFVFHPASYGPLVIWHSIGRLGHVDVQHFCFWIIVWAGVNLVYTKAAIAHC